MVHTGSPTRFAPLINVRSGAEGDKQTPNVTKIFISLLVSPRDYCLHYVFRAEAAGVNTGAGLRPR